MLNNFFKITLPFVIISITLFAASAQIVKEPKPWNDEWAKPYQPFRIAGNLYYVGTYELACYLITTNKGNILINTGLAASAKQIKKNIETLGFNFKHIKMLLNTQAHYDHLGAMATIKKSTGAQFMINEKDLAEVKSGGSTDYAMGNKDTSTFKPIKPNRLLRNGDTVVLGNMQLVMLHHPGHTKGSCSFLFTVKDELQSYKVLIANMPSIVTDIAFNKIKTYPEIAADYAFTLAAMKNLSFDLWVASHASQFNLHAKRQPGNAYNPAAFKDQAGYDAAIQDLQKDFDEKMKQQ